MIDTPSRFRVIRKASALARIEETREFIIEEKAAMCAVVVSQTSCNDRNHPILRGVIAPHQDFFFFAKIMILLDF